MWFRKKPIKRPSMTLEGVMGPNSALDTAEGFHVDDPFALCTDADGRLLYSSGADVFQLNKWGDTPVLWASFAAPVTALAARQDCVAVGMDDGQVVVCDPRGTALPEWRTPVGTSSVTDCVFLTDHELAVIDSGFAMSDALLSEAPWSDTPKGKVITITKGGPSRQIAENLSCPMAGALSWQQELVLCQLESAELVNIDGRIMQAGLPAYLGRIRRSQNGFIIACLARRDPLIEFLKGEAEFIADMKSSMDPKHWISPRFSPDSRHDLPIELGAARLFGETKPWAPSFSYGLIIETDETFTPVSSAHSRANGSRHAITDALDWNGDLIAVSKASGEVLRISRKDPLHG